MRPPAAQEQMANPGTRGSRIAAFPVLGALGTGLAVLCLLFLREIQAAVDVWDQSTAYSHCYLVLPMALYLLWERRGVIALHRVEPDFRFASLAVPLTVFWLVAERLGIMEARQLAVVAGVQLLLLTVLGRRLYWSISGPLLYLFFLVPFGAFLTPVLQQFTATFSILGLDLLGIPNFSDKFTIETPAGIFFVAEACAGLRFLIAAIAFGVFYSLLSYTSLMKRLVFIAASIIVPVVANGFRALGIVVLGQILGSAEAAAADHIIYGWVFFSAVMLLLIAGGHAFRDADQAAVADPVAMPAGSTWSLLGCVASVVVLLCLGPAFAGVIDSRSGASALPEAATIVVPVGCSSTELAERSASQRLITLVCGGERFDVSVQTFAARSTSSAMISERRRITQEIGAENATVSVLDLPDGAGSWTVVQTTDPNRVTGYAGWVDGLPITNSMAARVAQARDSIVGSAYAPALITVTAAEPANSPPLQRRVTLERLTALLRGQVDLNARMAAVTRLGGQ